jgi:transketolase
MQKKEGKVYEVGYIIVPTVAPDHVAKEVDALKAILSKNKAEVISEEFPIPLTRIGVENKFGQSGTPEELFRLYGISSTNIIKKAHELIKKTS